MLHLDGSYPGVEELVGAEGRHKLNHLGPGADVLRGPCRSHRSQNVQLQLVHGLPANATFGELLQSQVSRNDFSKHGCLGVGRHVAHAVEMGDGVRGRATNRFGARKLVLPGENQTQIVPGSATALGEPADLAHGGMRDPPRFRSLLEEKGLQSITCRSLTTT